MNVIFLGGASGIGASCTAIQLGEQWVLVDAGIRMDPNSDRLPDLSMLQTKQLAAIFVTHAHADHIGALPLVHQAFPTVPIYASRATMLIMEVMLADALQIMAKRASTEFEVPLYDETTVSSMLHRLRPLPMTGSTVIAELPNVTVHTARAGHVAGAISIGFDAPDGRILVSGDVSVTPQHTIPGAHLSTLRYPDLFILESTYGNRLHPNRQAEEERLAQTVAEAIERGGHTLIPAFALGRAQEVLRILHTFQRRGTIPEFPVWVDGLVRRVCSTYTAIPDALTPTLQRQITRGYPVFFSGMIRTVTDGRQRERILQGNPCCIVSSSGMLTGGPSAFYASHIAEHTDASILITGYQDDESPGHRLLALADQNGGKLDINEQTISVRCHFNRYHLSAHADGNELTAMVSAIKPKRVALVHGDPDSRKALAQRMQRLADVIMPTDGQILENIGTKRKTQNVRRKTNAEQPSPDDQSRPVTPMPLASHTQPFTEDLIEALWLTMQDGSGAKIVNVRELALAWYGLMAGEKEEQTIQSVLEQECRTTHASKLSFVPVPDMPRFYRVRVPEPSEENQSDTARMVQPGTFLLIQAYGEKITPAVCYDVRGDAIWVYLPGNESNRNRFPRTVVMEIIGKWQEYPITDIAYTRQTLADMVKSANRWQRINQPRTIVQQLQPGQSYELDEIANILSIPAEDIVARLALVLLLNTNPRLFITHQDVASPNRHKRYMLHEEWKTALAEGAGDLRPDQMWILSVVEQRIGNPPDLYRRSVNPDTGEVTLCFHFPAIAREYHKQALALASEEAGVTITIAPQPHQGALTEMARKNLPEGLSITKTSLHHDRDVLRLRCTGTVSQEQLQSTLQHFHEKTGWTLEIESETIAGDPPRRSPSAGNEVVQATSNHCLDLHTAMAFTRAFFKDDTDFYKVSADQTNTTLILRFHFPAVAVNRYTDQLKELAQRTGWNITIYPEPHQGAMENLVRRIMPSELEVLAAPSLYRKNRQVLVKVRGKAEEEAINTAKSTFSETTGWTLDLQKHKME